MSTRMPSFLLGGINITYNFLGSRTARTAAYGFFEVGVKLIPVMMFFGAAAAKGAKIEFREVLATPEVATTERRMTLTQ